MVGRSRGQWGYQLADPVLRDLRGEQVAHAGLHPRDIVVIIMLVG